MRAAMSSTDEIPDHPYPEVDAFRPPRVTQGSLHAINRALLKHTGGAVMLLEVPGRGYRLVREDKSGVVYLDLPRPRRDAVSHAQGWLLRHMQD